MHCSAGGGAGVLHALVQPACRAPSGRSAFPAGPAQVALSPQRAPRRGSDRDSLLALGPVSRHHRRGLLREGLLPQPSVKHTANTF
eukprot:4062662-Pyramimonas_sp.AAC.1